MDKLLPGLIVAAISGLTFLAYKHPQAYHKIHTWLMYTSYAFIATALIWDFSGSATIGAMLPFVGAGKIDDALKAASELRILNWGVWLGYSMFISYLLFLDNLPLILGNKKKATTK